MSHFQTLKNSTLFSLKQCLLQTQTFFYCSVNGLTYSENAIWSWPQVLEFKTLKNDVFHTSSAFSHIALWKQTFLSAFKAFSLQKDHIN